MKQPLRRALALLAALAGLLTGCANGAAEPDPVTEAPLPVTGELQIYCFQAGKADAFLLWNEAGAVLVDTGESGFGKVILAKLEELGIPRLEALILTHFDKDHVGGAKKLLESIPVGTIYQSNCPKTDGSAYEKYLTALETLGLEPVTLREEISFSLGDVTLTLNPPAREVYAEDPSNNSSLILTVTHGADRLLFTGDAEDPRLGEFLETDRGTFAFVKLPHHGKYQSTLETLAERTRPALALITSSDEEPEDAATLALLEARGIEVFLTRTAPVLVTSTGEGVTAVYAA